ncbi:MAG: M6 family metalloprotease domain-containing protein [Candidatus Wallbacteria bacterium]|nr:M6 family metalloprotease domain-containing protein [Candidatus Wallbacteria bacterium]
MRFLLIVLLFFSYSLHASRIDAPPHPDRYNYLYQSNLYPSAPARGPIYHERDRAPYQRRIDVTGTATILTVPVAFSDRAHPGIDMNLLAKFKDYYEKSSHGNFSVQLVVTPTVYSTHTYNYWGSDSHGIDTGADHEIYELAREAVRLLTASGFDFQAHNLDTNHDNIVDHFMIIHAGNAQENGNSGDIWSHSWKIINGTDDDYSSLSDTPDGEPATGELKVVNYCIFANSSPLGIMVHEFGHDLGLVDFYDTTYGSYGTGNWDVMSLGCWNGESYSGESPPLFSAYERFYLGWIAPLDLSAQSGNFTLPQMEETDTVYKISLTGSEYFLLENRGRTGYDAYLPGGGMLIWHVDEQVLASKWLDNNVNSDYNHKGVDLEEADASNSLDRKANKGDQGDPFPGTSLKTSFTPDTAPSSNSYYAGLKSAVFLKNIHASDAGIGFDKESSFGFLAGIFFHPLSAKLLFMSIASTAALDSQELSVNLTEGQSLRQISAVHLTGNTYFATCEINNPSNCLNLDLSGRVSGILKTASLQFTAAGVKKTFFAPAASGAGHD